MAHNNAAQRTRIRTAILRYVRRFPRAADTVEGIVMRWLPRRGFEAAPGEIDSVLQELVHEGRLESRELPGGRILFRVRGKAGTGRTQPKRRRRGSRR